MCNIPRILVLIRKISKSKKIRDIFLPNLKKLPKPRLLWHNPKELFPSDWFSNCVYADYKYYFNKQKNK